MRGSKYIHSAIEFHAFGNNPEKVAVESAEMHLLAMRFFLFAFQFSVKYYMYGFVGFQEKYNDTWLLISLFIDFDTFAAVLTC